MFRKPDLKHRARDLRDTGAWFHADDLLAYSIQLKRERTRILRIAFNEYKLDYLIVVSKVLDLNGAQHVCRLYKYVEGKKMDCVRQTAPYVIHKRSQNIGSRKWFILIFQQHQPKALPTNSKRKKTTLKLIRTVRLSNGETLNASLNYSVCQLTNTGMCSTYSVFRLND